MRFSTECRTSMPIGGYFSLWPRHICDKFPFNPKSLFPFFCPPYKSNKKNLSTEFVFASQSNWIHTFFFFSPFIQSVSKHVLLMLSRVTYIRVKRMPHDDPALSNKLSVFAVMLCKRILHYSLRDYVWPNPTTQQNLFTVACPTFCRKNIKSWIEFTVTMMQWCHSRWLCCWSTHSRRGILIRGQVELKQSEKPQTAESVFTAPVRVVVDLKYKMFWCMHGKLSLSTCQVHERERKPFILVLCFCFPHFTPHHPTCLL